MKKTMTMALLGLVLFSSTVFAQEKKTQSTKTEKNMQQVLIDKLIVPAQAKDEVIKRMAINFSFISQQPGFIKHVAYQSVDLSGDITIVTVATWESASALLKAREVVQAEYKRTGFDLTEFCKRLNIKIERGIYQSLEE